MRRYLLPFLADRSPARTTRGRSVHFGAKWVVQLITLSGVAGGLGLYLATRPEVGVDELVTFIIPAGCAAGAFIAIPFTRSSGAYYGAQAFATLCFAVTVAGSRGLLAVQILILLALLTEIIVYEPYPNNLVGTLGVIALASAIHVASAPAGSFETLLTGYHFPYVLPAIVVAIFGSLMTKYRELVVDLTASGEQLMESVVNLTRANTAYQDYAIIARERAAESERQRITRDIHDIVGYTLTNNMMLMEAALDLMKENALALPGIIETARKNAEEGLEQVRFAMYQLREPQSSYPIGLNAITRLAKTFEEATAIRIHTDYGNMPLMLSDDVDSAIYHLVQEALVNSFRHGRATEVHIQLWRSSSGAFARVRDNGIGASEFTEGIGLSGMRERIEHLGGTLSAEEIEDGFVVAASIPLAELNG